MFEFIFIIIIIYVCVKKSRNLKNNNMALFYEVIKSQGFSNVKTIYNESNYVCLKADLHGENFLFEVKNNLTPVGVTEINKLYHTAKSYHIHNCILVFSNNQINSEVMRKIEDYNIQLWDTKKLQSLLDIQTTDIKGNTYKQSVLQTSNTSDDKCKIESSYEPIQDYTNMKHSVFGSLFNKPDRL